MRRIPVILLSVLTFLFVACHKDHQNQSGNTSTFLTTTAVTDITDTSAKSGGTFNGFRSTMTVYEKGIQWDTAIDFSDHWSITYGSGTGNFSSAITGLFPNTRYLVRAFATNDSGHLVYGDTLQFTTTYTPGKYMVSTVAGTGATGANNGDALNATFNAPDGLAVDLAGNIYVADYNNKAIRKIDPSGNVSTLATLDGRPNDVITDSAGNVYVAEANFKVLKITPSGQISTIAGSGLQGHADGVGTAATLFNPITIAIDPAANLYIGDIASFRKITPDGTVSTMTNYFTAINSFRGIAVDQQFNLYETDVHSILRIDNNGNPTSMIPALSSSYLSELRLDAAGNIYAPDALLNKIWLVTAAGTATVIAGTGAGGAQDGNSGTATFHDPIGLAVDNKGNIYVADAKNNKIRKISPQ